MIDQTHYEVERTSNGWRWTLFEGDVPLATSPEAFTDSQDARAAVDSVRDAVAEIDGVALDSANTQPDTPRRQAETPAGETTLADRVTQTTVTNAATGPRLRIIGRPGAEIFGWRLEREGRSLAIPNHTYTARSRAKAAAEHFSEQAVGAVATYLAGTKTEDIPYEPFNVGRGRLRDRLKSVLTRGRRHREFRDNIDVRIVVSGIRGKSSTVRRLDDVFNRRGYDVLTKITGNQPHLIRNGDVIPIERPGPYTTLYENINVLREFGPALDSYTPDDVAIFENQGLTEYTTRLFNERFVDPHVVILCNIRQDHQDTLGRTRREIARAFARTIPPDTHVVSGELHPVLHEYMRDEIMEADATMELVSIPDDQQGRIGAETVYAVNDVLRYLDMEPVPEDQLTAYLDAIQPNWVRLPRGQVFNGAEINDIESTEAIRRALAGENYVLPFVYLRGDRRSRTASFVNYLNTLADRGLIREAAAGGAYSDLFAEKVSVPATAYDRTDDAAEVLNELLERDHPVLLMGNTVDQFMRDMEDEISEHAQ